VDPTTGRPDAVPAAVLLGAGIRAAELVWRAARPLRTVLMGAAGAADAAMSAFVPASLVERLEERGRAGLVEVDRWVEATLRYAIGRVVTALLATTDLNALVREHVDLDVLAAGLDVDKVVARVDLDAVVRRIDVDAIAAGLDVDAVVGRVDLDTILRRVDVDGVVARVDLDAIVRRIDVDGVAAGLDVDAVVARVDFDAALAHIDLVRIAREVIDALDLPEIIRQSTGTLTSDTVRSVRSEAMHADDIVTGVVDRLLRRSRGRTATP
jgi:hypothetical protein